MTNFEFEKLIESIGDVLGKTWRKSLITRVYKEYYLNRENSGMVTDVIDGFMLNAKRPPTPLQFKNALYAKKRSLRSSGAIQACDICGNTGLIIVKLYTDIYNYEYRLPGEEPPKWYNKLSSKSKQPISTKVMRCKCGLNRNQVFMEYDETMGKK
jgi:hypothetical protein